MSSKLFHRSVFLLLSCFSLTVAAPNHKADLSNLVVVGDSLSAGFQNYSLYSKQQVNGYANLIATQAGTKMVLPLVPFPGVPNFLELISPGLPPVIQPIAAPPPAIPRENYTVQPTNLAVPGMTVADVLNKRPGPAADPFTNIVLGFPSPIIVPGPPRSQVEQAVALKPTTVLVWVGNNDVLLPALLGDPGMLTPVSQFAASYRATLDALATTKATIVTANIPDVTATPYFTSAAAIAAQTGVPLPLILVKLGIGPLDYVRPGALSLIQDILRGITPGPLPSFCPAILSEIPVAQVPCRMTLADATIFRLTTDAYNLVIAGQAATHKAVLVNIHALVNQLRVKGYQAGGDHLTTAFLGGLFSLDGVHPTNTGYAIIANEFIQTMNQNLATGIPPVNVVQIEKQDPLVGLQ